TTRTSPFASVVFVGYQRASFMSLLLVQVFAVPLYTEEPMSPSLLFPACPPVTNKLPSCKNEWPEQKMLYAAKGAAVKLLATGSHRVGLFPLLNDGQKSTFLLGRRLACAAM